MKEYHLSKDLFALWQEAFSPSPLVAKVVQLAHGVEDGTCRTPSEIAKILDRDLETIGDCLLEYGIKNGEAMTAILTNQDWPDEYGAILMKIGGGSNDDKAKRFAIAAEEYGISQEEIQSILDEAVDFIKDLPFEKRDYGTNGFLTAIGTRQEDSFAKVVEKIVFAKTNGDKETKEKALAFAWDRINTLVFWARRGCDPKNENSWSFYLQTAKLGANVIDGMGTLNVAKDTHCPEYEWRAVENRYGDGYVWHAPNKFELFLLAYALPLTEREVHALYGFCGYALTAYNKVDNALRALIHRATSEINNWESTQYGPCDWDIVTMIFEESTGSPIESIIKEERKRILVPKPEED